MKYECPSCKMQWDDDVLPLERISHPACIFCVTKHTQKELLNWQMDHLENISAKNFPLVLRHFYRYVESNIKEFSIDRERQDSKNRCCCKTDSGKCCTPETE